VLDCLDPRRSQLSQYDSVFDKHLKRYYAKGSNFKTLVKSGLLRRDGQLNYVPEFAL